MTRTSLGRCAALALALTGCTGLDSIPGGVVVT